MRYFHFLGMLLRRLLRRPGFLAVVIAMPLITLVYAGVARQDAGMVTVALAREEAADPLATGVMERLEGSSQLLRFVSCGSPAQAIGKVEAGKADCAWVFRENMLEKLRAFLASRSGSDAFVTVYQREDSPLHLLAREKLNAQLFTCLAQELYLARLDAESATLAAMTRQEKLAFWENTQIPGQLFTFTYEGVPAQPEGYLLAPLRGLLAVALLLGAMACTLYDRQDRLTGTFAWLPNRLAWLPELLSGLLATGLLSIALMLSLTLTGLSGPVGQELLCLAGLILGCTGFSMAAARLLSATAMAAALPVTAVLALTACPVFWDLEPLAPLGLLLPVSHYLRGAADPAQLPWAFVYGGLCFAIARIPSENLR